MTSESCTLNYTNMNAPAIWPSIARIAATLGIFIYHYLGLIGKYQYRLDFFAIFIFCFLSGYLAKINNNNQFAWYIRRYLGIMIPYWMVIFPVIIANYAFQYKTINLINHIVTVLGGNMFLDDPIYVIAWYVTFILILYFYALIESFLMPLGKISCMIFGLLIFFLWFKKGYYFISFIMGLRLSEWFPIYNCNSLGTQRRKIADLLFAIQKYCYAFFLIHGATLLFFIKIIKCSPLGVFCLSIMISSILSVILYKVSKRAVKNVSNKILNNEQRF